ncbi:MAG: hypothetical protein K0S47_18 [Herbinix sp.]|jgi:subtilisin family serine protease|nr:hypothetical protein [Herbinix sp.]
MENRTYIKHILQSVVGFLILLITIMITNNSSPIVNYSINNEIKQGSVQRISDNNPEDINSLTAVHPNSATKISDDTYSGTQWALNNNGFYTHITGIYRQEIASTQDIDMNASEAWVKLNKNKDKLREVVVAIIDTGVDYKHPDLADNIWVNEKETPDDGIDNDENGFVDDIYGWDFYNNDNTVCHYQYDEEDGVYVASNQDNDDHGTHIAGIIAAVANNNVGIAGVASNVNVKIMVLKINGGPSGTGNLSNAVKAVKYAAMMGADICNMSWGTSQYSEELKTVIEESDMLFVASAGNSGSNNNSSPIYPASYRLDNVISVTYLDANGKLTNLSNYGATTVDIAAPGEDIFSTVVGAYATMSGSSMASPQVSGVAAMLYSVTENAYPQNIKEIMMAKMKPIKGLEGFMINPGIPDALQSVNMSESLAVDTEEPDVTLNMIYDKSQFLVPVVAMDKGGSGIRVIKWLNGEKKESDFNRGMNGTKVTDDPVVFKKAGTYTFYISDYAGNSVIQTCIIEDDKKEPDIVSTYTVEDNYLNRTITVRVNDKQSGVKKVKYLAGERSMEDFLGAGSGYEIKLIGGKGVFQVNKDGIYSIYAIDYRGNTKVYHLNVKTIKATEIKFVRNEKIMVLGEQYPLRAFLKPLNTTDKVTYTSSNSAIAFVTTNGKVVAKKEGRVTITAKTSSGRIVTCVIIVKRE